MRRMVGKLVPVGALVSEGYQNTCLGRNCHREYAERFARI
jgi:hypothetical protein